MKYKKKVQYPMFFGINKQRICISFHWFSLVQTAGKQNINFPQLLV